ncbi:hypothetical protein [Nostoc sp. FACHB-892]|nr:hypothetical protein [Nostoc sp. FACHB-892]
MALDRLFYRFCQTQHRQQLTSQLSSQAKPFVATLKEEAINGAMA